MGLEVAWAAAISSGEQYWYETLTRLDICDGLGFAYDHQVSAEPPLPALEELISTHFMPGRRLPDLSGLPPDRRLLLATIERLSDKLRSLMDRALDEEEDLRRIPKSGVLQYCADGLRFILLVEYSQHGVVEFSNVLCTPDPVLAADPLTLVSAAKTDQDLDLVRRFLYLSDKLIVLRNIVVHVDRSASPSVFGPSIDTLFVTDWLFSHRFAPAHADDANQRFFRDPLRRAETADLQASGVSVLEVGTGSGMILASFTKNEPRLHEFSALDINLDAIAATYLNTYRQRQLHLGWIGDLGTYVVGAFSPTRLAARFDVVVVNPPYIPVPPSGAGISTGQYGSATLGTTLLEQVLASADDLLTVEGEMFMVMSNLSLQAFRTATPPGFEVRECARKTVPFRVEATGLDRNKENLAFLTRLGLDVRVIGERNEYWHDIILMRLARERQGG